MKQLQSKSEDELSEKERCECDVLLFLEKLLDIMNTEVAKNWLRMQQYLEVITSLLYIPLFISYDN